MEGGGRGRAAGDLDEGDLADGRPWNAPHRILGQRVTWERHFNERGEVGYERICVRCNNVDHGDCSLSHTLRKDVGKYGPRAAWGVLGPWLSASHQNNTRYWHKHEWKATKESVAAFLATVDDA